MITESQDSNADSIVQENTEQEKLELENKHSICYDNIVEKTVDAEKRAAAQKYAF